MSSVASLFGGMEDLGAFVSDDICDICWAFISDDVCGICLVIGSLFFSSFACLLRRLERSCTSYSLWKVIEFLGGEMDLRIFIASLKLSMKDLSGEHDVPVGLSMT